VTVGLFVGISKPFQGGIYFCRYFAAPLCNKKCRRLRQPQEEDVMSKFSRRLSHADEDRLIEDLLIPNTGI